MSTKLDQKEGLLKKTKSVFDYLMSVSLGYILAVFLAAVIFKTPYPFDHSYSLLDGVVSYHMSAVNDPKVLEIAALHSFMGLMVFAISLLSIRFLVIGLFGELTPPKVERCMRKMASSVVGLISLKRKIEAEESSAALELEDRKAEIKERLEKIREFREEEMRVVNYAKKNGLPIPQIKSYDDVVEHLGICIRQ